VNDAGFENEAADYFLGWLTQHSQAIRVVSSQLQTHLGDSRADLLCRVEQNNQEWLLLAEFKNYAYPSQINLSQTILHMKSIKARHIYPILILPWLSDSVMKLCQESGIGCIGLNGNHHVAFGGFYAVRSGASTPKAESKALQGLFRGKAARVLRALLRDPAHSWTNRELADAAGVSLGMTHKVKVALLERGWVEGLRLTQAEELLHEWREQKTTKPRQTFYTLQHGAALEKILQPNTGEHWLYAGYSAANWLAPLVRQPLLYVVADVVGLRELEQKLQLEPTQKGFNVVVYPDPEGDLLHDRWEASAGVWTTSPMQTYLELYQSHDRGREAAALIAKKYFGSKP
jgi:hypothetical protein